MHINANSSILFKAVLHGVLLICFLFSSNSFAAGKFNAQKRYLSVQPGQSIFSIVKVLYPNQQSQWPLIIKKVVKRNPHAFVKGDPAKIKAGKRIALPVISSKPKPTITKKTIVKKKTLLVGQVIKSKGKVFAISKKNKKRNLPIGKQVYVGDRIFTGVKGFVRLNMIDEAKIDLRCNSEMLIEDYQLLHGKNRSVIHLLKGSVKKITGSIGKMAEDIYEMHTPLATVGVRGTEYAIRVLQQHGCDGSLDVNSRGLFVKVKRGGIDIQSKKEKRAVNQGKTVHLADEKSKIKDIESRDGLFNKVADDKKSNVTGSSFWLLLLFPVIILARIKFNNANRRSTTTG